MPRRTLALLVGLIGFLGYLAVVVSLADAVIPLHWAAGAVFYAVAGLAWAWPAAALLRWAAGPRRPRGHRTGQSPSIRM